MKEADETMHGEPGEGVQPTEADVVTNPAMPPMDDDAGGPTADKEHADERGDAEAAAQLGEQS